MRSPQQLAQGLARQWQRADWREQHLLPGPSGGVWPLHLAIGQPDATTFRDDGASLRQHLQQWQAVAASGTSAVVWAARQYRGGNTPVQLPTHWVLAKPSECVTAIARFGGPVGAAVQTDYQALCAVLAAVDDSFHRLLVRRLALWRGMPNAEVITATRMALQLSPGCAQGKPLRALALAGNDSKFFERHAGLLTALLDVRFDGEASAQGLPNFLGASTEADHWLLVAPLAPGLLPFARQRVPTTELASTPLPPEVTHILLVENERCLHQLPQPLPGTVAILGAGLNLGWLAAPWLNTRHVAYWGDLDTWGLYMLAIARSHLPSLQALLMDRTTFDDHQHLAVPEPVLTLEPAPDGREGAWSIDATTLDHYLRTRSKGRLEQEFLPSDGVARAVRQWWVQADAETRSPVDLENALP